MTTWTIHVEDKPQPERVEGELAITANGDLILVETPGGPPTKFWAALHWKKAEHAVVQGALS